MLVAGFEPVAGLPHEVRDIEPGKWIIGGHHEHAPRGQALEGLARLQRRQRAFETEKVERDFTHGEFGGFPFG